jgi:hypothetical protein
MDPREISADALPPPVLPAHVQAEEAKKAKEEEKKEAKGGLFGLMS